MKTRTLLLVLIPAFLFSCIKEEEIKAPYDDPYIYVAPGKTIETELFSYLILDATQNVNNLKYQWTSTNNLLPDTNIVVIFDTGTYTVNFSNGLPSSRVIVYPHPSCFIPNVFRPGSGVSEDRVFRVNIGGITEFHLYIYTSSNILIYEYSDYKTHGWDGKYKGKDCPAGYYYLILKFTSFLGKEYTRTGYIQLLR
jgi:hypothetical protein